MLIGSVYHSPTQSTQGTHKPGESWASLSSLCPKDHLFLGHRLLLSGHKTWPLDSDWLGLRVSGVSRTAVRTKQRCRGWRTIAFGDSLKSLTRQRTRTRTLHMHSSFVFWWEGRKVIQNKVRGLTPSDFKTHHKAIVTRSVWYSIGINIQKKINETEWRIHKQIHTHEQLIFDMSINIIWWTEYSLFN